jgi:hypothetical protein
MAAAGLGQGLVYDMALGGYRDVEVGVNMVAFAITCVESVCSATATM